MNEPALINGISAWATMVTTALTIASVSLRRLTPPKGFFHTALGALAIAVGAAACSAAASAIEAHGFHLSLIGPAVLTAILSALSTYNPTLAAENAQMAKNIAMPAPLPPAPKAGEQ